MTRRYSLLLSGKVAHAFELNREDPRVRDRYGRHMFGQSLLLARRLDPGGRADRPGQHGAGPALGHALGQLQEPEKPAPTADRPGDLGAPRRPVGDRPARRDPGDRHRRIRPDAPDRRDHRQRNGPDGRDHWSKVFSALFAGAGVRGGQAIGQSDRNGAYPASRPYTPADLAATIYHSLGIDPETELRDRLSRPIRLCNGTPIEPLFSRATA